MTKENKKEYLNTYRQTHKEQIAKQVKEYYIVNKKRIKGYLKKYQQLHKEQKAKCNKKYCQSSKGKETLKRGKAKRRQLGFIPLNKLFEGCEGHHINIEQVIYIPQKLHRSVWHSVLQNINMDKINKLAFDYLKIENETEIK